ncbi:fumarylacetoacetate hydrolase domain-containing protein 2-like [Lineus longissimus]|uniref:fumarylacetoacetate hydrolase domain-containing protein 2-like n=1 Tax=Lineus longissimus TaxID=88925 RepID=UPI002B4CA345
MLCLSRSICALALKGGRANNISSIGIGNLRKYHKMRLVQFSSSLDHHDHDDGKQYLGVELSLGGDVVNLVASDPSLPNNMREFLEGGVETMDKAERAVSSASEKTVVKRTDLKLLPPITNPEKIFIIGMNYAGHCEEQNVKQPREPIVSGKFANAIAGPFDDIIYNDETEEMDWEVELGIVIGKAGKNIKESDAMDHVVGYTVCNDVSAREWQMKRNGRQWLLSKTFDTYCPLGPAIVTKESLSDPHNLGLRCRVNGVTKQDSNTSDLIFKTPRLLAHISKFLTLKPGDIILTGTPSGVGFTRDPPEFLKRGDIFETEIDEIGTLINKIV